MSDNGFAGKSALFKPYKRRFVVEDIPGVGKCRFRSWTERDRTAWEQRIYSKKGDIIPARQREQRRALIALSWCDGDGDLLLSEDDVRGTAFEDADSLSVSRMAEVVMSLVGLADDDVDDLEEAVKNSETTQGD